MYLLDTSVIDGGWSPWTSDSSCSTTCGPGIETSIRHCTNPAPSNGGADCEGSDTLEAECEMAPCPGKMVY